jgi:hypothetical protein
MNGISSSRHPPLERVYGFFRVAWRDTRLLAVLFGHFSISKAVSLSGNVKSTYVIIATGIS